MQNQGSFRHNSGNLEDFRMERTQTKGNSKIALLFDAGTFVETGAYIKRAGCAEEYEGVICGYGSIDGKLAFAFVQDGDRNKGAFDATGAKKITALYKMAMSAGAPVIGVFDSAGALVPEGSAVLSAYGELLGCISAASGIIPQFSVIVGSCTGLCAVAAGMFDVKIAVDTAKIYLTAEENHAPDADMICKNEDEAFCAARKLIALLPQNNKDYAVVQIADPAERAVTADVQDTRALLDDLCDAGNALLLGETKKDGMLLALASIGGVTVGVVATDRAQNGGKLTDKGARRAAKLITLCDSLHVPVVTLVDSEGIAPKCTSCGVKAYGALSAAYATATCAKVTVVTGNAYGAAFTLLGSRAQGADLALALPDACISAMDPVAAVAFLYNDEITQQRSRADVEAEYKATKASAKAAAEKGDIDDLIPAEELRARICAALYMLNTKSQDAPRRKHTSMSF